MARSTQFDLDRALLRQQRLDRIRHSRRRLRFDVRTLIVLMVAASLAFACMVSFGAAVWDRARLRYDYFAKGLKEDVSIPFLVAPFLVVGLWIGVYALIVFFAQRMRRR